MDELRKLQLIQLENLEEIDRICEKNHINYFLMFGTLLGAARHNGFIPWDDDLDIAMLRKDYDNFLQCAKAELKTDFFLHTYDTDANYFVPFARIRRNDTTFIPKVYRNAKFKNNGIWVDIFPLDFAIAQDSFYEKIRFISIQGFLRPMASFKMMGLCGKTKFKSKVGYVLSKFFDIKTILKLIDMISRMKNNDREAGYYVCFGSPYRRIKNYYPIDCFNAIENLYFEGKKYPVPVGYEEVLSTLYGDYNLLPPEHERVGHLPEKYDFSKIKIKNEQD